MADYLNLEYADDYISTHIRVEEWDTDYQHDCWYKDVYKSYEETRYE